MNKGSIEWYNEKSRQITETLNGIMKAEYAVSIDKMKQMSNDERFSYMTANKIPNEVLLFVDQKEFSPYINGKIPLKDWLKYNKVD